MGLRLDRALGRLLDQYSLGTNIRYLITTILEQIEDTDSVLESLATARWLSTAEGIWLDGIGDIVGLKRFFTDWPEDNIFTFRETELELSDPDKSFGDNAGNGGWFMSKFGAYTDTPIDDDTYRHWLEVKIYVTYAAGTIPDIYTFIKQAFDIDTHIVTDEAKNIYVELNTSMSQNDRARLLQFAPKLAGVQIAITD